MINKVEIIVIRKKKKKKKNEKWKLKKRNGEYIEG